MLAGRAVVLATVVGEGSYALQYLVMKQTDTGPMLEATGCMFSTIRFKKYVLFWWLLRGLRMQARPCAVAVGVRRFVSILRSPRPASMLAVCYYF